MKTSFICTVLNEGKTIETFLSSLAGQTKLPDEIVVVDGGSKDKTVEIIQNAKCKMQNHNLEFKILKRIGANRAEGRNFAVKEAKNEIIAISDAGCELDKNWVKEITGPFEKEKEVKVVAGYYRAEGKNTFEKSVIPFVLVMPEKVKPGQFLPASRSMAIKKSTFLKLGGFPEKYPDNEDYVFANLLKQKKIKIFFQKSAIVKWFPRTSLFDFSKMIYIFARGDSQAGLRRLKVLSIYLRYLFLLAISFIDLNLFLWSFCLYLCWSVFKNYRYVKEPGAIFWLPILQITSDFAVMFGTLAGISKRYES